MAMSRLPVIRLFLATFPPGLWPGGVIVPKRGRANAAS
jgi:hypothetical protein